MKPMWRNVIREEECHLPHHLMVSFPREMSMHHKGGADIDLDETGLEREKAPKVQRREKRPRHQAEEQTVQQPKDKLLKVLKLALGREEPLEAYIKAVCCYFHQPVKSI